MFGTFTAVPSGDINFGISVSDLGDLNEDGIWDIVVGADLDDNGGTDCGAIYTIFLTPEAHVDSFQKISSTTGGFTYTLSTNAYFGNSVERIGDLNQDGRYILIFDFLIYFSDIDDV